MKFEQFREPRNGIFVIVDAIVEPAIEITAISAFRLDHVDGCRLTSTFIATSAITGQERGMQSCWKISLCFEEGSLHRRDHLASRKDVALNCIAFPGDASSPC